MPRRFVAMSVIVFVCHCFGSLTSACAAETFTQSVTVEQPESELVLVELDFGRHYAPASKNFAKGKARLENYGSGPYRLRLFRRGDRFTAGAFWERLGVKLKTKSASSAKVLPCWPEGIDLDMQAGRLSGRIVPQMFLAADPQAYRIDATIAVDGRISGTFASDQSAAAEVSWSLTGRVISGDALEELQREQALVDGARWANWMGAQGHGHAPAPAQGLVESFADARIAWVSEALFPGGGGGAGHPGPQSSRCTYNGALVADGKVLLTTVQASRLSPDDEVFVNKYSPAGVNKSTPAFWHWMRQAHGIIMDDVVTCLDAATGKLLWRTVFHHRGSSGNLTGKGRGGMWCTGVIHDGTIFFMGTSGWIYAVDLATGQMRWQSEAASPERIARTRERIAAFAAAGTTERKHHLIDPYPGQIQGSLALVDGIVVCPFMKSGKNAWDDAGLIGLDTATGDVVWGPVKNVRPGATTPLIWRHAGRSFVLTPEVCLDAANGELLWRLPKKTGKWCGSSVVKDILIVGATAGGKKSEGGDLLAYRLSPEKPTLLWQTDAEYYTMPNTNFGTVDIDRGWFFFKADRTNPGTDKDRIKRQMAKDGMGYHYVIDINTGAFVHRRLLGLKSWGNCTHRTGDRLIDSYLRMFRIASDGDLSKAGILGMQQFTCTTPALADGRLFIRQAHSIVCVDLRRRE